MMLALTFARLLWSLPHVFAPGRRDRIHALWCVNIVMAPIGFWWAIWSYHDVDPWTFRAFFSVMLTPALMYLTVATLVSDSPSSTPSWRDHFYARRRLFFALMLASAFSIGLRQHVVLGDVGAPLFDGQAGLLLVVSLPVILAVAGLVTARERVHVFLVVVASAATLVNYARLLTS